MGKIYSKEEWVKILKDNLTKAPEHDGEHVHEYYAKEDVAVVITAGGPKNNRYYSFGGPHWGALIDFSDNEKLRISYTSPIRRPTKIDYRKIKSITLTYISG
jgi:hypothetical protein